MLCLCMIFGSGHQNFLIELHVMKLVHSMIKEIAVLLLLLNIFIPDMTFQATASALQKLALLSILASSLRRSLSHQTMVLAE